MRHVFTLAAMTLAVFVFAGCSQENQTQETQTEESTQTTSVEPVRHEIEANSEGYVPAVVHAEVGQEVTLVFTRTTDETCATEVVMPSQEIEADLPLNEAVEITLVAGESGEIDYSCAMNMWHGKLIID
jgi:plastocyanin domain-containing protein